MDWFVNLISFLLPYLAILAAAQDCYYPSGTLASDYKYVPCTGSRWSSCCIPDAGDICLSNGLCWWTHGPWPYRATCTDKEWVSDNCPRFCLGVNPSTWQQLYLCGGNQYCCGKDCCSDSANTFYIAPGSVINDYGQSGYSIPAEYTAAPSSTGKSSTVTSAVASTSTSSTPSSSKSSTAIAIGVGVGVGVGVVFLLGIILAFFFYRRRHPTPSPAPVPSQTSYPTQQYQQTPVYPTISSPAPPYNYPVEQKPVMGQVPVEADSVVSPSVGLTELDAAFVPAKGVK